MLERVLAAAAVLLLAEMGLTGAAQAQSKDAPADWVKRPTPEDLMAVWPREAWRTGLGGRAVISCRVSLQGALFGCIVEQETPAGAGFGAAAIALTPQLLMRPEIKGGKPVVSSVRIPVNFQKPDISTGTRIPGDRGQGAVLSRPVLTNVAWASAPTYAQVAAAYPEKARKAAVGGRATLSCQFKAGGKLGSCDTISEEPRGQGFAAAARSLIPHFVGPETLSDGRGPSGAVTQIAFVFAPEMLDPTKRVIGKPQWAALPSGDDFMAGYPRAAAEAGIKMARVALSCVVGEGGLITDCTLASEEPAGLGFGAAALALVKSFKVRPWTAEGLPTVGGTVRVPIRYQLPDEEPAAPRP